MAMEKLIRTIRRYEGAAHVGLRGHRVVLLSVHRGDDTLVDDQDVGKLRAGDWIEFAPLIQEAGGSERMSFVTSDGRPDEFGAIEGWYEGTDETTIVLRVMPKASGRGPSGGLSTR